MNGFEGEVKFGVIRTRDLKDFVQSWLQDRLWCEWENHDQHMQAAARLQALGIEGYCVGGGLREGGLERTIAEQKMGVFF